MIKEIKEFFHGDVEATESVRKAYSHDASLFEIKPELVVFPKDVDDLCNLVNYVTDQKASHNEISLTGRSGGTDMSGGAINDSIIVEFDRYFNKVGEVDVKKEIDTQPGVFYRDFEPKTLAKKLLMPSYPASREICMMGGIVNNNSGGEKSLIYGKTIDYVKQVKVVLADGKEHTFGPITQSELHEKLLETGFEGDLYRKIYTLATDNEELLKSAKPKVSKNSTGYNLWDVWDGTTFDMSKLFVGSQGTLGLLTEATFSLVPTKPLSGMIVVFMKSLENLSEIVNAILPLTPSSLESFDDHTLKFAFRFFYTFHKTLGWKKFFFLGLSFIPVLNKMLRYLPHFPKLVILVEFEGDTQEEIDGKIKTVETALEPFDVETQLADDKKHEEKFWIMRRESFNLLRKNVKRKHTAPFVDDLIVPPATLPEFLPQLIEILERYQLLYTIAGHVGDGNFHIIPLMDLSDPKERAKIPQVLDETVPLILKYGGSLSGEHNDGLIRGPFLKKMYDPEVISLFKQVKRTFDPLGIFNPHKKIDAEWDYSKEHIRQGF
jgi:FAD/FMN-containing dehydrogenase